MSSTYVGYIFCDISCGQLFTSFSWETYFTIICETCHGAWDFSMFLSMQCIEWYCTALNQSSYGIMFSSVNCSDVYCHTRPLFNFSLTENLASLCLQDRPQSGSIITQPTDQIHLNFYILISHPEENPKCANSSSNNSAKPGSPEMVSPALT